jgi:hypothetical protein
MNRPTPPRTRGVNLAIPIGLVVIALIAILAWLRQTETSPPPPTTVVAPTPIASAEPPQPAPALEPKPEISNPVDKIEIAPAQLGPLPPRDQSDEAAKSAAATLAEQAALNDNVFDESLVRRFVATVDNLPRETLPMRVRLFRGTPGQFVIEGKEESRSIAPENWVRYAPFIRFLQSLDSKKLVAVYLGFYPMLQEEYRALGYPKKQFNDRVVEAIDDMLAAPELPDPIMLVQPKVMYKFADPELESMSAGRKIMVRIGIDNARIVKAKLREIRAFIAVDKPN